MSKCNYQKRMNFKDITGVTCADCLKDTEDTINTILLGKTKLLENLTIGERLWYETYVAETVKFITSLKKYSPENVLDVGSGYGRVIELIRKTLPCTLITGTENVKAIYNILTKRFQGIDEIDLQHVDVNGFLEGTNNQFDMATCMMNTYGNINDEQLFSSVMGHTNRFVFTLYNSNYDVLRAEMYKARCHKNFEYKNRQYEFSDSWSNVKVSRGYSKDEIIALVERSNGKVASLQELGILYYCVTEKLP